MKVMFTNTETGQERNYRAAMRTTAFTISNGAELCKFLELMKEEGALDELCTLHAQIGSVTPNIPAVIEALRQIVETLARQAASKLDEISHISRLDADGMARWCGAKLTDLLGSFESESSIPG